MSETPHRYASGLPRSSSRRLAANERREVAKRLRTAKLHLALGSLGVLTSIGSAWVFADGASADVLDSIGGPYGLALCGTGLWGLVAAGFSQRFAWRTAAISLEAYLLVAAGLHVLGSMHDLLPASLTWCVVIAAALLGNAYAAAGLAQRFRLLGRRRQIVGDLVEGRVEVFEGPLLLRAADDVMRRLASSGYLEREEGRVRLELLPRSGLVIRVGERPLERVELAHLIEIAPAQPHALRVALPQGLLADDAERSRRVHRRSLTPAEREELSNHIRRLRRRWSGAALATVALCWVVLSRLDDPERLTDVAAFGWYALAAFAYLGYGRRLLAARRLADDRRLRWVVTVDESSSNDSRPPKLEVLPVSRLAWTENAGPALWRVHRL